MKYKILFILIIISLSYSPSNAAGPDGYLVIPSIGLYKSVSFIPDSDLSFKSHYYDLTSLNYGIAHLEHTMWNNTLGGRTVLVGHTPGGFESISSIKWGDSIILIMNEVAYEFTVFSIYKTHRSDNSIFSIPPVNFEVVLITCTDKENERLIIKAQ